MFSEKPDSGSAPAQGSVRFGVFELDSATRELRRNGLKVRIQEQPFRVLKLLLERRGELVTREEFRTKLWPADTFVDFEHGLHAAINKVRDALGDSAASPRFIATVPRCGYRFLGPLEEINASTAADHAGNKSQPAVADRVVAQKPTLASPLWLAAGVLLMCLGAFINITSVGRSHQVIYRTAPLTSLPGVEQEPSFSPDGSHIAFAWDGHRHNGWSLYIKQLGSEDPFRLTPEGGDDHSPAWSPDGQWIAFVRHSNTGRAHILLIPAIGGAERPLAEVQIYSWEIPRDEWLLGFLAWSPDSKSLVIADRRSAHAPLGLSVIALDTQEMSVLTTPTGRWRGDYNPCFSPDGRNLAFRRLANNIAGDLYILPLSANLQPLGEARRVTFLNRWVSNPVWTSDGKALLFTSDRPGHGRELNRVDISGATSPQSVTSLGEDGAFLAISHQSRRLSYSRVRSDYNIWRLANSQRDIRGRAIHRSTIDDLTPLISSTWDERNPQYSPDGNKIVFQSTRSGTSQLWTCDHNGLNCIQLTSSCAQLCGFPHWSPDGTRIVFFSRPKQQGDIFTMPASGGVFHQLTNDTEEDIAPTWSQSGDWIYFASQRSGESQVWKTRPEGGPPVQVTRTGGVLAQESPDRRFLYYSKILLQPPEAPAVSLWRMPLGGGEEMLIARALANYSTFAVAKLGVYFLAADTTGSRALDFKFAGHDAPTTSRAIAQIDRRVELGFAVSPDERWILYSQQDQTSSDLMMLEDFP